jgi:tellurite resistance protein/uncharacterized protein (DUF697 family)
MLSDQEKRGVLAIALLTAFADGSKSDAERDSLRQVADGIGNTGGVSMPAVLMDVMMRRIDAASAAALLTTPESRLLAYEVAVQVADADGLRGEAENRFLTTLAEVLGITPGERAAAAEAPDAIATAPLVPVAAVAPPAAAPQPPTAELDATIRNTAILCGALELLPQSIAGMAVIPLQMRMVHRIAAAHGHNAAMGNIKELLATLGIGLTSQYVESLGRKLLGGLLKRHVGSLGGKIGAGATGVLMSFVTTYALGQVARQYYASGRRMDSNTLRGAYESAIGQARQMQGTYMPAIQQQAAGLDVTKVMAMVRGQ